MAKPDFQILSDTVLYSNSLTPLQVSAIPSNDYSSNYFVWDFGDGKRGVGERVDHVYDTIGDFDITLTQYLSSGEPVVSDPKTVTVSNLIPNLMMWDDGSYNAGSITASVKNITPFVANVYNSWQQYDENSFLYLYVENSKSIPFDITDKRIHLKPNWRFVDKDDNIIEILSLTQDKIYASQVSGEIYLSTNFNDTSVFVGVSSQAKFYFVDDTPSGIEPNEDYLPSTIIVTQNLSGIYGDDKFTQEDYLQYPSLMKSVFIDNIIPDKLSITSNGIFNISGIKYINTKIPYNIRLVDSGGNFIKTNPNESVLVSSYEMDIGFIGDVVKENTPSFNGNTLERFVTDFSNLGGFFESHFIPVQPTTEYVTLTASTKLDYTRNQILTRYGAFSDENSNKIYRVSYIEGFNKEYIRKDSGVVGNVFDGFYSNKFGIAIESDYTITFLDSDDSRIENYDTSFELISSVSISSYATDIDNHSSPSAITIDNDNNKFITLHDASKLLYIDTNSVYTEFDVLSSPATVDILSDNEHLYISYTSTLSSNSVGEYTITRTQPPTLSSIDNIDTGFDQTVDLISNRDGDKLFTLTTNVNDQISSIVTYATSNNSELSSVYTGYNCNFITLDTSQRAWTIGQSLSSSDIYDTLYCSDGNTYPLSTFSPIIPNRNIGGIAGDSYDNVWFIDSNNDRVVIFNSNNLSSYEFINIVEDQSISENNYVAYCDWNGFRWYNKFGYSIEIITYELSGQSDPFKILPKGKHNLQKINEDFNATETLKSYRTTDLMLNYENLFDNFLGSIYGNNLDDGTYIGKNIYEKIANFVMNHGDIETCSIDALESFCEETGIEFESRLDFPRDIKRLIDLFSIKFKKLWGDDYKTGFIEDYRGDELNTLTYNVSADPQVKFIAKEKFNNFYTIIDPLLIDGLSSYPLSSYEQSWGWGLSIPANGDLKDYYEFYEMLPVDDQRWISVIDWENPLTDTTIEPISSYSDYMGENGIVSTVLGDKLRDGLGLYL